MYIINITDVVGNFVTMVFVIVFLVCDVVDVCPFFSILLKAPDSNTGSPGFDPCSVIYSKGYFNQLWFS